MSEEKLREFWVDLGSTSFCSSKSELRESRVNRCMGEPRDYTPVCLIEHSTYATLEQKNEDLKQTLSDMTSEWESACERSDYKGELIDELVASRKAIEVLSNGLFQVSESSIYNYVGIAKRSYKKAKDILGEEK